MTTPAITDETSHAGLQTSILVEGESFQTGWELGGVYRVVVYLRAADFREAVQRPGRAWRVDLGPDLQVDVGDLAAQAAALARETPQVESKVSPVPKLSGNLAEDVHVVCGLTWDQIGGVFKVSERAAAGWRMQGVPAHREATMDALRAIGLILIGGLGADGVARWLMAGAPSRLERLRAGEVDAVAAEARSYLDVPAT